MRNCEGHLVKFLRSLGTRVQQSDCLESKRDLTNKHVAPPLQGVSRWLCVIYPELATCIGARLRSAGPAHQMELYPAPGPAFPNGYPKSRRPCLHTGL